MPKRFSDLGDALVLVPVTAASVVAFLFIGRKSFWGDEAFSVALAGSDWGTFRHVLFERQANMGVYHLLLKGWTALAGDGEAAVRSLSALAAVGSVGAAYLLASRLFGRFVGLVGGIALALNPFLARYAQEARGYTFALLAVTLASLAFVRLIEAPRSRRAWFAYVVLSSVSLYCHFFSAFVLLAHLATLPFVDDRRTRRKVVEAAAVVAVLATPLALFAFLRDEGQVELIPGVTPYRIVAALGALSGGTIATLAVFCGLAAVALVAIVRSRGEDRARLWPYVLVLAWLVVPIAAAVLLSLAKPLFLARYLIGVLPPLAILIALGAQALRPRWAAAALAIAFAASAHALAGWYPGEEKEGLDFRSAAAQIADRGSPRDGIAFYRSSRRLPIEYYLRRERALGRAPTPVFPAAAWGAYDLIEDYELRRPPASTWRSLVARAASRHRRIWLVQSRADLFEGERAALERALDATYDRREQHDYGELQVVLFQQ
ncbi:MAG: glycosyltransferase family 39 protein [Actinomycetota bacterium]